MPVSTEHDAPQDGGHDREPDPVEAVGEDARSAVRRARCRTPATAPTRLDARCRRGRTRRGSRGRAAAKATRSNSSTRLRPKRTTSGTRPRRLPVIAAPLLPVDGVAAMLIGVASASVLEVVVVGASSTCSTVLAHRAGDRADRAAGRSRRSSTWCSAASITFCSASPVSTRRSAKSDGTMMSLRSATHRRKLSRMRYMPSANPPGRNRSTTSRPEAGHQQRQAFDRRLAEVADDLDDHRPEHRAGQGGEPPDDRDDEDVDARPDAVARRVDRVLLVGEQHAGDRPRSRRTRRTRPAGCGARLMA